MWIKWFPWRFVVRRFARAQGFLDPISFLAHLRRFAQPSEVMAPTELLRASAVLQARGLMNSQAIQHNLDWIWPYWVERQFDPKDDAFVPRAFNVTHINLTHRNWTAVGIPESSQLPLVDPRGLVTPCFDGWSLDAWIIEEKGQTLIPSRMDAVTQTLVFDGTLKVETAMAKHDSTLETSAEVVKDGSTPVCIVRVKSRCKGKARLVISLRPYNPEGVSFIHSITSPESGPYSWSINGREYVYFDTVPQQTFFSEYKDGDVYGMIMSGVTTPAVKKIKCNVGMATAAVLFKLEPGVERQVTLRVPLPEEKMPFFPPRPAESQSVPRRSGHDPARSAPDYDPARWKESLEGHCRMQVPDKHFQFLYDASLRMLVLHSPGDVYPGPYTYKRFWFRDAAFILHAMLCAGLDKRAEHVLDRFPSRQTPFGYFLSQEGEWDSNGEALWIIRRFCELTGRKPKPQWKNSIYKAAKWIERKRLPGQTGGPVEGLLPAGFSAEHLGPNDYYYWDDFWGIAGMEAAAYLAAAYGDGSGRAEFQREAADFRHAVERSIRKNEQRFGHEGMPASPYRRMDAGAIGSLAAGYPLKTWGERDARVLKTADFLVDNFFVDGGFFQEISHSGINAYLTLHVAQVFLRAGDKRYIDILRAVAALATSTGQWPEAIHPRTHGGCMGDGQHIWAVAEWVLMLRNCFVREEEAEGKLVLCSGVPVEWAGQGPVSFGPAPTSFGKLSLSVEKTGEGLLVRWDAVWHANEPAIEIRFPGLVSETARPGQTSLTVKTR